MNRPGFVLDASAVLCLLFREAGADRVLSVLDRAVLSSVNFIEILSTLIDRGVDPSIAIRGLEELGIPVVGLDRELATTAALLRRQTRELGLSLGDRACLSLASQEKAIALTADRAWIRLSGILNVDIEMLR